MSIMFSKKASAAVSWMNIILHNFRFHQKKMLLFSPEIQIFLTQTLFFFLFLLPQKWRNSEVSKWLFFLHVNSQTGFSVTSESGTLWHSDSGSYLMVFFPPQDFSFLFCVTGFLHEPESSFLCISEKRKESKKREERTPERQKRGRGVWGERGDAS